MMGDSQVIEYDSIFLAGLHSSKSDVGKIRLAGGGIGWKEQKTGRVVTVPRADMHKVTWMRVARDYALRILLSSGQVLRFDGFPSDAVDELRVLVKRMYDVDVDVREWSVRGWNWGQTEFIGDYLQFSSSAGGGVGGGRPVLEVPLSAVANTSMTAKNEVSLEMKTSEEDERRGDQLVEMRFYIPSRVAAGDGGDDPMDVAQGEVEEDAAAAFHATVKAMADIGVVVGDAIVPLHELPFLIPRGRYEVDLFGDFMRMHGKSYDYKILFKSVKIMFLLPKPDDVHSLFVIGLDPPIRQGQTVYPYLVMQFLNDEDIEVSLTVPDEELKSMFGGRLRKHYEAPTADVVSNILSIMTGVNVVKESRFSSHQGASCVKASYKANEGYIYPLDESLLFVPKPASDMEYADIAQITFSRLDQASSSRTFDMKVSMRSGTAFSFVGLPREEHAVLEEFLRLKGLRIKTETAEADLPFENLPSSSDDDASEDDAPKKVKNALDIDEDEDSEDDEDFVAGEESDVEEEYDEDYDSPDEDGEGGDEAGGAGAAVEED
eukprot:Partr_v1_DN25172_c0_g1_i1_m76620 putative Component of the FACT complex, a general chromatin factor that acts to reorganize nucleosomes. The FACT complex is involved in multiple processes that require DNA as a template such as mRNA elongation, DNA replication and DNA repair. During transcription elongation the FACT complex acts as a histone chaperone that both destabilizes and restores nucleosomal structure. It facilitates the passage of RNA polymerase II and transcription by promoting the disso